jgi:hypothetical protein
MTPELVEKLHVFLSPLSLVRNALTIDDISDVYTFQCNTCQYYHSGERACIMGCGGTTRKVFLHETNREREIRIANEFYRMMKCKEIQPFSQLDVLPHIPLAVRLNWLNDLFALVGKPVPSSVAEEWAIHQKKTIACASDLIDSVQKGLARELSCVVIYDVAWIAVCYMF